jgi:hypothetical protein
MLMIKGSRKMKIKKIAMKRLMLSLRLIRKIGRRRNSYPRNRGNSWQE